MTFTTSPKPAPAASSIAADVREHLPRLGTTSSGADEPPVAVDRDAPRDEQQVARPDGVGVVADRLGELGNADLLASAHPAPARIALSVLAV